MSAERPGASTEAVGRDEAGTRFGTKHAPKPRAAPVTACPVVGEHRATGRNPLRRSQATRPNVENEANFYGNKCKCEAWNRAFLAQALAAGSPKIAHDAHPCEAFDIR